MFLHVQNNDTASLEKFAALVQITVKKLQTQNHYGELEDGAPHSMLVKKLPD